MWRVEDAEHEEQEEVEGVGEKGKGSEEVAGASEGEVEGANTEKEGMNAREEEEGRNVRERQEEEREVEKRGARVLGEGEEEREGREISAECGEGREDGTRNLRKAKRELGGAGEGGDGTRS